MKNYLKLFTVLALLIVATPALASNPALENIIEKYIRGNSTSESRMFDEILCDDLVQKRILPSRTIKFKKKDIINHYQNLSGMKMNYSKTQTTVLEDNENYSIASVIFENNNSVQKDVLFIEKRNSNNYKITEITTIYYLK